MGEPKPIASLSSSLLARKGHARPAMRPQGFAGFGALTQPTEDLGWNDMGHDHPVSAVPTPAPVAKPVPVTPAEPAEPQPLPPVLVERGKLSEVADPDPNPAPAAAVPEPDAPEPVQPKAPRRVADATLSQIGAQARAKAGKSAFTLRLEADRHLRLRLACAVRHSSAQTLVTEALDRFLDTLPEIEELARRLPSPGKH